jgi:hypothetical protein
MDSCPIKFHQFRGLTNNSEVSTHNPSLRRQNHFVAEGVARVSSCGLETSSEAGIRALGCPERACRTGVVCP